MKSFLKLSSLAAFTLALSHLGADTPPLPQASSQIEIGLAYVEQIANNGTSGFFADQLGDQIIFFNNNGTTVSGSLKVGDGPFGVAASGNIGICANRLTDNLSVIDINNKTIIGTIDVGINPRQVALSGSVGIVANESRNTLNLFNIDTLQVTSTTSFINPQYVALSGTTGLEASPSFAEVNVIRTNGQSFTGFTAIPLSFRPSSVALDGTIGVAVGQGALSFITTTGTTIPGTTFSLPNASGCAIRGTTALVTTYTSSGNLNGTVFFYSAVAPYSLSGSVGVGIEPYAITIAGTTAYVYNDAKDTINLIDINQRRLVGTITYPPYGQSSTNPMAIDGNFGLAGSQDSAKATLFDTRTNQIVRSFDTPGNVRVLGCALQGSLAGLGSDNQIFLYNTSTGAFLGSVSSPGLNFGLAINGTLGIAVGNLVTFFNTETRQILGTVNPGSAPRGVDISGTTCVVCARGSDRIVFYDTTTRTPKGTFSVNQPYMVSLTGNTGVVSSSLNQGLVTFIETNPPQITGSLTLPLPSFWTDSNGTVAIISTGQGINIPALTFVDVTNKSVLGTVSSIPSTWGCGITESRAFAGWGNSTIQTFLLYPPLVNVAGNAGVSSDLINELVLSNTATPAIQDVYNDLSGMSALMQTANLNLYNPAYKTIQYSLEKLDLLIHKELESVLYGAQEGLVPFIMAGYDHLKQDRVSPYAGYDIDSYYQFLGLSYDWGAMKYLAAVGASESYMSLDSLNDYLKADLPSEYYRTNKASYNTVYGTLGISGHHKRWQYGLDALYGYSFIHTKRALQNATASSHHGAWDLSFDAKLSYKMKKRLYTLMPYDSVGYLYGHENEYTESGASGLDMKVKNENISVIRNALGLAFDTANSEAIKFFVDGSWVYDLYKNSQGYKAAFINTELYGTYHQTIPSRNYGRVHTGFKGVHKDFDWRVAYTGLFGKHFQENSVSVKFAYKF